MRNPRDAACDLRHRSSNELPSRRRFLRGLGVALALPALESLRPRFLDASEGTRAVAPRRMAFVSIPNGVQQDHWFPEGEGSAFELNRTMRSLEKVKAHIQVLSGLDHGNATPGPDGAGDHARANATLLTGVRARKTAGSDIHLGISVDQVAANRIGHLTRFPSLEFTCDRVRKSGLCDSGYSCAYLYNISWQSTTTPMTPEPNPRLMFQRLFGSGDPGERGQVTSALDEERRSVLDFVLDDAKRLERQLGGKDRRKLDEYLTGIRGIEQRIARASGFGDVPDPPVDTPEGIPADYGEHMRLMFDLLALAFQTDSTRIATLLLAGDGTNYAFPQIGIPEGHHYLTHAQRRSPEAAEKVTQIDEYYMRHFAEFLEKLEATEDVDGRSVLRNSMIVYGGAIADGNLHTHSNLPVILAGGGGGELRTGRSVKVPSQPMTNLFLGMLDYLGVTGVESFGDSTGRLHAI
jgi:hypothetical protein